MCQLYHLMSCFAVVCSLAENTMCSQAFFHIIVKQVERNKWYHNCNAPVTKICTSVVDHYLIFCCLCLLLIV